MKADYVLPGVAVKYQVSIFFYSQNGSRQDGSHGRTTTVFLYCNEKCQSFRYDDFRIPFRGVLGLYLSGDHYNWIKFHDNFNNWAPQPIMIGSSDDSADMGTVDVPVPRIPNMDAVDDLQAVSTPINPNEFTNQPAIHETTLIDTPRPKDPPTIENSLVSSKPSSAVQSDPSPMKLHTMDMPSPWKDRLAHRTSKADNHFLIDSKELEGNRWRLVYSNAPYKFWYPLIMRRL
jgi:hypothetical protein